MRPFLALAAAVIATFAWAAAMPASAHGKRQAGDTSGIAIANLTHGEMAVLTHYRDEIIALAERVKQPDEGFRTLTRYAGVQYSYCFWGKMPGTISDEESPFNECAHAYLAATKAILLRMRELPEQAAQADAIVSRIDVDMVLTGATFIGCRYSGEGYNTAEFIRPDWLGVPAHLPSALSVTGMLLLLPGVAFATSRLTTRRTEKQPQG